MESRQVLALIGSLLLLFGVFAPFVSLPIVGNMTYFQNGKGDGTIVLLLAVVALALTFIKRFKWLWLPAIGSAVILVFTYLRLNSAIDEMKTSMNTSLSGNPFRGFADMAVQAVQLQWGWAVLIIGIVLLGAAAAMKPGAAS